MRGEAFNYTPRTDRSPIDHRSPLDDLDDLYLSGQILLHSSAVTPIIESKYWIRLRLLPQQGGLARDTHRAECALSAAPIRKGVNAEAAAYAKVGGWDGQ